MARSTFQRQDERDRAQPGATFATLVFDRAGVRAVDQAAITEFGIPGLVLMENAARGLAEVALQMLDTSAHPAGNVLIICGSGNNGGDGYALARHLHNHGVSVTLIALGDPRPESDAGVNRAICERMRLPIHRIDAMRDPSVFSNCSLVVDAIFGTGLDRPVTGDAKEAIERINGSHRPVLAADVPSGLDADTGEVLGIAVKAARTVTFVGLKRGFLCYQAQRWLGDVTVADIGAPRELLERFGTPLTRQNHGD